MNFADTFQKMIEAARGAAQVHWNDLRDFAEVELKHLAEADFLADNALPSSHKAIEAQL